MYTFLLRQRCFTFECLCLLSEFGPTPTRTPAPRSCHPSRTEAAYSGLALEPSYMASAGALHQVHQSRQLTDGVTEHTLSPSPVTGDECHRIEHRSGHDLLCCAVFCSALLCCVVLSAHKHRIPTTIDYGLSMTDDDANQNGSPALVGRCSGPQTVTTDTATNDRCLQWSLP